MLSLKQIISSARWIIGTILVGALGTGLWESFLSDFSIWLGKFILELASLTSSEFKDTLYNKVSDGPVILLLRVPVIVVLVILVMIPIALLIISLVARIIGHDKFLRKNEASLEEERKNIKHNLRIAAYSLLILVYSFIAFQSLYTATAANFLEKSIEIVSPHVSKEILLQLRADYRGIKEAEDYYQLYSELRSLEKNLGIELPEFEPI